MKPITISTIKRAASAIEHRIHMMETKLIPEAEERRNKGVLGILKESLDADMIALKEMKTALEI